MDVSSYVNRKGRRSLQVRLELPEARSIANGETDELVAAVREEVARLEEESGELVQKSTSSEVVGDLDALLPPQTEGDVG